MQQGEISFVTSRNIYVKFDHTDLISKGDTLLSRQGQVLVPCMVVINTSSTSCVCDPLPGCQLGKGDVVYFSAAEEETIPTPQLETEVVVDEVNEESQPTGQKETQIPKSGYKEKIRGRISAAGYSNFSSDYSDNHRGMLRMSFRADHLRNSPVSIEAYLNYRQNYSIRTDKTMSSEDAFRVYNLALTYDVDSSMHISLGRKINHRASSLGAIDGLQAEKHLGSFFMGGIIGFRPNFRTYGLNTQLFEYGAYTGFEIQRPALYSSTTLGLLEQQNGGSVDRRYVYFQHNSNIGRSLYLFGSLELDLFANIQGQKMTKIRLTNMYLSARYRFSRMLDLTLSYDARRNIIYYETYKTEIERMLEDDEARQGARARINFRPFKYVNSGISFSKRFQIDQQNKSNNINAYVSHSKLPAIGGRMSVRYNWNQSSYLESKIFSIQYCRPIIKRKLDADVYFRTVNYQQLASETTFRQQYFGGSLDYTIGRAWMFSLLYEWSSRMDRTQQRINSSIIFRF